VSNSAAALAAPAEPRPAGFTSTDALLALMVLIWGVNFIVLKAALREISPPALNAIRFGLGTAVVAVLAWAWRAPRPGRRDLGMLALLGLLGHSIYQQGFIGGVARTRAGNAALIMAAIPVQTAIFSHLLGHHRLRPRDLLGLLLGAAGIAAIVFGSGTAVSFGSTVKGDLLVLGATFCWSSFSILSKPLTDRYGPMTVTAWTMAFGTVPLALLAIPAIGVQRWDTVSAGAWGATAFSSLGALVLAYLIWARGVQRLGAARTAIYSNFTPVVAMLAAWVMLGETPTAWQVGGAAGIFTGIGLTRT
jgi:drug/metabolite transporter (DMT)-like permease